MLTTLYSDLCRMFPGFRKSTRRHLYQLLARSYRKADWTFMNYGYAPLDPLIEKLSLDEADEPDRYSIQLYHHVASAVALEGKHVLEVGSGRGGGACYIAGYLKPETMVGLDFSAEAVDFCNGCYCTEGLTFITGDAENLPFAEGRFDAVVNVESAHCYVSMDAFLAQVRRVLRPGGHFLCADFRTREHMDALYGQLDRSGLTMLRDEDITDNVIKARDLDDRGRLAFIQDRAPRWLVKAISEFGGVKGSRIYRQFRAREVMYRHFVLQKSAA